MMLANVIVIVSAALLLYYGMALLNEFLRFAPNDSVAGFPFPFNSIPTILIGSGLLLPAFLFVRIGCVRKLKE